MLLPPYAHVAMIAALLAGCVSIAPPELADEHPANPKAPAGLVGTSAALESYKNLDDFAARAAVDANAPPIDHAGHAGMQGMQHGAMPGMQPGATGGMQRGQPGMEGMDHSQHGGAAGGARIR